MIATETNNDNRLVDLLLEISQDVKESRDVRQSALMLATTIAVRRRKESSMSNLPWYQQPEYLAAKAEGLRREGKAMPMPELEPIPTFAETQALQESLRARERSEIAKLALQKADSELGWAVRNYLRVNNSSDDVTRIVQETLQATLQSTQNTGE